MHQITIIVSPFSGPNEYFLYFPTMFMSHGQYAPFQQLRKLKRVEKACWVNNGHKLKEISMTLCKSIIFIICIVEISYSKLKLQNGNQYHKSITSFSFRMAKGFLVTLIGR